MTFTIAVRSPKLGQVGVGLATCSIAAGGLCAFYSHAGDLIVSQAYASPEDGYLLAREMDKGATPEEAFAVVKKADPYIEFRQIMVVPRSGPIFAHSGPSARPWVGHIADQDFVVAGNVLAGERVVKAMRDAYVSAESEPLAERILRALEAGRDAGGQAGGTGAALTERSASIKITKTGDSPGFAVLDLRVDIHHSAVHEMRRLYEFHNIYGEYSKLRDKSPKDSPSMVDYEAEYLRKSKTVIERPSVYR
jgi:uncharacterized Ntn-hydrolase superfamily protein